MERGGPFKNRRSRLMAALASFLLAASCSNSCGGCGGLAPLTEPVPQADHVEGAGAFRLTDPGRAYFEANLGTALVKRGWPGGQITFEIPTTTSTASGNDYTLCPAGPNPSANPPSCLGEVNLANMKSLLTFAGPNEVRLTGTIPVRIQRLPIHTNCFTGCSEDSDIALNANGACPGGNYDQVPLDASVVIKVDDEPIDVSGYGFSAVTIVRVTDQSSLESNLSDNLHVCGGSIGPFVSYVKAFTVSTVAPLLQSGLTGIAEELVCHRPDASGCPLGSNHDGTYCRLPSGACVSSILGTAGRLEKTPPGGPSTGAGGLAELFRLARGALAVDLAAGGLAPNHDRNPAAPLGDLYATNQGATLGLVGAANAMTTARCAPPVENPKPTDIPIPNELYANTVPNWPSGEPGPHFGFALSERYLNYALRAAYNTGQLCLELSTREIAFYDSTALSAALPSLADLGLQRRPQALSLQVVPGGPPTLTVGNGTDPLVDPTFRLRWLGVGTDLYMVLADRPTRVLTLTQDLDIAIQVDVEEDLHLSVQVTGAHPVLSQVTPLVDIPANAAGAVAEVINRVLGAWLQPPFASININSLFALVGMGLSIPSSVQGLGSPGLMRLQRGSDAFLGVFGNFLLDGQSASLLPLPPPSPLIRTPAAAVPSTAYAWAGAAFLFLVGRRRRGAMLALGLMVCVGTSFSYGCTGCSPPATSPGPEDASGFASDTAIAPTDAGRSDAAMGRDAMTMDIGAAVRDSGIPRTDGGALHADASTPPPDAAVTRDAASPDSAELPDAAPPPVSLNPGLVGAYTSATVAGDTVWVAGYAERDPSGGYDWGDLVVGPWNGSEVAWTAIDGVPSEPTVDARAFDVHGFRGGQTAPGDDVGLYTSMAVDSAGQPAIAYYDASHRALKLARFDGATWTSSVVEQVQGVDLGRFAKLGIAGQRWVVVYQSYQALPDGNRSAVRVAIADETPGTPLAWSLEDATALEGMRCDPGFCPAGTVCGGEVACEAELPPGTCAPECAEGQACVDNQGAPACKGVFRHVYAEVPRALGSGLAVAILQGGDIAIAYYDGSHGLWIASREAGGWSQQQVDDDGEGPLGLSPALAVDAMGDWHLVYGDGTRHQLRYMKVLSGDTPLPPEVIDSGDDPTGSPLFPPRWVGADPSLLVDMDGTLHVSYQDSTAGTLRVATGTVTPMGLSWERRELTQAGWAGAFSQLLNDAAGLTVVNWARVGSGVSARGEVRLLQP